VPDFTFERECAFALQILKDPSNDYLAQVAAGNPDSLKEAIINVAAVGLSLSPVFKFAYLVPRKKRVCLDVSYQGYVELATSRGVVRSVKAVIVHDNDKFEFQGINKEPVFSCNPFAPPKERGAVVGGFVVAETPDGHLLVDFMAIHEIYAIRDRSEGWKAHKERGINSPWLTDEPEMIKKTLIRRAQKSWPKSAVKGVLEQAAAVADDADGIDFKAEQLAPPPPDPHREEGLEIIREMLAALEREEAAFVAHLGRMNNRKIESLTDLTDLEVNQAVTFLEGVLEQQKARIAKLEAAKKQPKEA